MEPRPTTPGKCIPIITELLTPLIYIATKIASYAFVIPVCKLENA